MAQSRVVTIAAELDKVVAASAKLALNANSPFWDGIIGFMNWFRAQITTLVVSGLKNLPVIGKYAERIGSTVTDIGFSVVGTLLHLLKVVFSSSGVWTKAHDFACLAWNACEDNGLLAQTYAYSKKMVGYFMEIIKQCLERAIITHNMEVTAKDKADIHQLLNKVLC